MNIPAARIYFPEGDRRDLAEQIDGILASGALTLGKYTSQFEEEYARYCGVKHAIAVNSGTSALEIPLRALDARRGSVVVPTNTFIATAFAVAAAGARVVFADCDHTLCLDPQSLRQAIAPDTVGVIFVHIGGLVPPQIREVQRICREKGLFLIEDAAHAHGSTLDGHMAGSFGDAGAFSFYPTKVMTSAEGGMLVTNRDDIAARARVLRDQGKAGFNQNFHTEMGYNWRMSEIHAAIGLSQFHRLEQFIAGRRGAAAVYDAGLKGVKGLAPVAIPDNARSNYYKYVAALEPGIDRTALKKAMREKHTVSLSGEVYELPVHLQPVFKQSSGYRGGEFPVAEDLCSRHICLPVYATMSKEEASYVVASLKEELS